MEPVLFETDKGYAIIPKIQRLQTPYKLEITDSFLYLLQKGGGAMSQAVGAQFGLIGVLFSSFFNKRAEKKVAAQFEGKTRDQIVDEDEKSIKIPFTDIEQYEAKTGFWSSGQYGTKPITLWIKGAKTIIFLPKDLQQKLVEILQLKCPGKQKSN